MACRDATSHFYILIINVSYQLTRVLSLSFSHHQFVFVFIIITQMYYKDSYIPNLLSNFHSKYIFTSDM